MSDTDSFIEEVSEEVRRDRLYGYLRKYGWMAVLGVVLIVGGAAFFEYRKAQATAEAEALGDRLLEAMQMENSQARSVALSEVPLTGSTSDVVVAMVAASELAGQGDVETAVSRLEALTQNSEIPDVYRQIAGFKALLLQSDTKPAAIRADEFASFAAPGHPMRLLAEEQIALIAIEQGNIEQAISGLQAIASDAEVSSDLQQRAMQVIVALGGEPDVAGLTPPQN